MTEKQIFKVLLEKHENMEATGITIPSDVEKIFGRQEHSRAVREKLLKKKK